MSRKKTKDAVGSAVRYELMNYKVIPVGTSWCWVSIWRYWLVLGGTGSGWGGTGWYMVVLGQFNSVMLREPFKNYLADFVR